MKTRGSVLPLVALFLSTLVLAGCASSYTAPSRGVDLATFGLDEATVGDAPDGLDRILSRKPQAQLPARIAVIRVQSSGYRSYTSRGVGRGAYSVVTDRDVEREELVDRLRGMDGLAGVAPINRLLVPDQLRDNRDLRRIAASVHANMLLIYTIDTVFETDDALRPLTIISLGLFPTKNVRVRSTAAALLIDTVSGYVYGVAESTNQTSRIASGWTSEDAADRARRETEQKAFTNLVGELEGMWGDVVRDFG